MPTRVRSLIISRLYRLSSAGRRLLGSAAVLGPSSTFAGLIQVSQLSEREGIDALNEVLHLGLLQESVSKNVVGGGTRYSFVHELMREIVSTEEGEAQRMWLHRQALSWLQSQQASASLLAYHAQMAGLSEKAFEYSVQAGDEAIAVFALQDALEHYEQAEHMFASRHSTSTQYCQSSDILCLHLYEQLGQAYEHVNAWGQAERAYLALLALAHNMGNQQMTWRAFHYLTDVGTGQFLRPEEARRLLQVSQQKTHAPASSEPQPETMSRSRSREHFVWSSKRMLQYARQALRLAHGLPRKDLIALSAFSLGTTYLYLGRWSDAVVSAEEAYTLFVALGNREMQAEILGVLSLALCFSGYPYKGVQTGWSILTLARELDSEYTFASSAMGLVWSLIEIGEYAEAVLIAKKSLAVTHRLNSGPWEFLNLWAWGDALLTMFQLQEAHETYTQSLAVVPFPLYQGELCAKLCVVSALLGDWKQAYLYAQQARAVRDETLLPLSYLHYWYETEALLRHGEVEQAEEGVRTFGTRVGTNRRFHIAYLRSQATLSRLKSKHQQAIESLREAAQLAEEIGLPGEMWQLQAALGEVYERMGDKEQAQEALAKAEGIVQELAQKIGDEALRAQFLAASQVRSVVER